MGMIVTMASAPFLVTTSDLDGALLASRALHGAWHGRRETAWRTECEAAGPSPLPDHRLDVVITAGSHDRRTDGTWSTAVMTMHVDADDEEGAERQALFMLDMLPAGRSMRAPRGKGLLDRGPLGVSERGARDPERIGPVADGFVEGRHIGDFSTALGSYGMGGVGWCGWRLNEGSWLVLPLANSSDWMWLTTETHEPAADRSSLTVQVDRRIVGCHPAQLQDFHPWHHRYGDAATTIEDLPDVATLRPRISRFERDAGCLVIEAETGATTMRYQISDSLPRPRYAGSGEERLLQEGDDLGGAMFMAHSPYLDC